MQHLRQHLMSLDGSEFWLRSFWLHGTHRTGDQHNKKVALANQTRRSYRISQVRNLCGDYQIIMDYTANINELSNYLNWDYHRTIIYQFYQDFHLQYTHVSPSLSLCLYLSLKSICLLDLCYLHPSPSPTKSDFSQRFVSTMHIVHENKCKGQGLFWWDSLRVRKSIL